MLAGVALLACEAPSVPDAGGTPDAGRYVPTQRQPLGLNDVTLFLPLEPLDAGSPFPRPTELLPLHVFERVTSIPGDVLTDLSRLRVVAVRFDACDRSAPGECPAGAPGVFRLVLQPVMGDGSVEDVTFHAFYPVSPGEVWPVVDELRALAALAPLPVESALAVRAAFLEVPAWRAGVGALVSRYARAERLTRLTLFGQLTMRAALIWVFRGQQLEGGAFVPMRIPSIADTAQQVLLTGGTSYSVTPVADVPAGFRVSLDDVSFRAATSVAQREALEALGAVDNPELHTADTVQCVSCHVATTLLAPRAADAGVSLEALESPYRNPRYDLTPLGSEARRFRTLRALGYLGTAPLVSQRVVNESAQVVDELERRFPPAP